MIEFWLSWNKSTFNIWCQNNSKKLIKFGPWDELWEYKQEIIKKKSAYGHFPSYKLRCLIIKGDDDLRQELIAMQLIRKIEKIWRNAGLTLSVRTYDILVTSEDSGILGKFDILITNLILM